MLIVVLFVIVVLGVWAIDPAPLPASGWSRRAGLDPHRRGLGRVMTTSGEKGRLAPNLASRDLRELYVEVERDARELWTMCPSWHERATHGARDMARSPPADVPEGSKALGILQPSPKPSQVGRGKADVCCGFMD